MAAPDLLTINDFLRPHIDKCMECVNAVIKVEKEYYNQPCAFLKKALFAPVCIELNLSKIFRLLNYRAAKKVLWMKETIGPHITAYRCSNCVNMIKSNHYRLGCDPGFTIHDFSSMGRPFNCTAVQLITKEFPTKGKVKVPKDKPVPNYEEKVEPDDITLNDDDENDEDFVLDDYVEEANIFSAPIFDEAGLEEYDKNQLMMSPIRPAMHPDAEIPLLELPVQSIAMDIEIVDLTDPVYNCIDLTSNEIIYID